MVGVVLAGVFSLSCFGQDPAAPACVTDLESLFLFLLENDTGARDQLARLGQKHFEDALAHPKSEAARISGPAGCTPVINNYLREWRRGHLGVDDIKPPSAAPAQTQPTADAVARRRRNAPELEILSEKTLYLRLKNFEPYNREPLLALLKTHRKDFQRHPNWIIDLRGNGGGSDSSYQPLLPWLLADETVDASAAILATPANIDAWGRMCALYAPGDAECQKSINEGIERMRKAAPGTFVAMDDGGPFSYSRVKPLEPRRPSRVAVLIDGGCGSSCEEFALAVRQSFTVKLIGQPTFGSLDHSNLRPHDLPSGMRRLWYATTRSTRLPGFRVDVSGVQPDIYLPLEPGAEAKAEEVQRVRSWLERGSLQRNLRR